MIKISVKKFVELCEKTRRKILDIEGIDKIVQSFNTDDIKCEVRSYKTKFIEIAIKLPKGYENPRVDFYRDFSHPLVEMLGESLHVHNLACTILDDIEIEPYTRSFIEGVYYEHTGNNVDTYKDIYDYIFYDLMNAEKVTYVTFTDNIDEYHCHYAILFYNDFYLRVFLDKKYYEDD